jgi:tetratricopeptide (TPR) repeat protein
MEKSLSKWIIVLLMFVIVNSGYSQSAKKCYKNAIKLHESQQDQEALEQLNRAILKDEELTDAYVLRAQISEKLKNMEGAVLDYEKASELNAKIPDYYFQAGRLNYTLGNYAKALNALNFATAFNSKNFEAYLFKGLTLIKLQEYNEAFLTIDQAMEIQQTHMCFYIRGMANDSLKNYPKAIINYKKAIALNPSFQEAYLAASNAYIQNQQFDEALFTANMAVQNFPEAVEGYETRSIIYYKKGEILNSINDLSKWATIAKENTPIIFTRGKCYFEIDQFQNAKSDFSKVMVEDPSIYLAIFWRGRTNEELLEATAAIEDYQLFLYQCQQYKYNSIEVGEAKLRLLELNRENNTPSIIIDSPEVLTNRKIALNEGQATVTFNGRVIDQSEIDSLTINNQHVDINNMHGFTYNLQVTDIGIVNFAATDIYGNHSSVQYNLILCERDLPAINILVPIVSNSGEITLDRADSILVMEGIVKDASLIKELYINDERISYNDAIFNPVFKAMVSISNRQFITIKAIDEFNNVQEKSIRLNRSL